MLRVGVEGPESRNSIVRIVGDRYDLPVQQGEVLAFSEFLPVPLEIAADGFGNSQVSFLFAGRHVEYLGVSVFSSETSAAGERILAWLFDFYWLPEN
jgi:hypothetical protein